MSGPEPQFQRRVLVAMTPAEADLWKAFKAVLREQGKNQVEGSIWPTVAPAVDAVVPLAERGPCQVQGPGTTRCHKPQGHGQRHRYTEPPPREHVAPLREWTKRPSFTLTSGSRRYEVIVGNPCRIVGQRGLWKVVSIEAHNVNGRTSVEVTQDRTGHSRTFSSEQVIYKRPPKEKS